ncbi:MAG: ATP-binding protein [Lachnospiraceae bacterium]|nr:ATP-binding protein [Lachnospiraceae bacterium]
MMPEISLNILDVAQNSVKAGASLVTLECLIDTKADTLTVIIDDDGCGMSKEQVEAVTDPFFTTRTTRKVGLGVPFFKMAAESTGGSFEILSEQGKGTKVTSVFVLSSIDRMPLGDMVSTVHMLITQNGKMDLVYRYNVDGTEFMLDTREMRAVLGDDVSFMEPEVSEYIREYLKENTAEVNNGQEF